MESENLEYEMRYYSYEEIRDCTTYVTENHLDCKHILASSSLKLIIEQLGIFENLLLEAIKPIRGREQGIYIIVCTDMIWQVLREILNIPKNNNFLKPQAPQIYKNIMEKANKIHELHSFIRHPTAENLIKYRWVMNREWSDAKKEFVRNIAQIIYKLVMSIRLTINMERTK